ncbi:MAG: flotillin domain-containing protein [Planctomycetota bacterium]|nr:flotillin domain-containing protein [Planctomycetota bacterium]
MLPFAALGEFEKLGLGIAGAIILILALVVIVFVKAYKKTSSDKAFVRTGQGRAKVVVDGGAFVFSVLHQVKWISLETMRLTVDRRGRDALITNDRYRVDITTDFYVRVEPNDEQILRASRSLGEFSLTPESVMDLVGAKLIGALRSIAATQTLLNLHEKRDDFADKVQEALNQDLNKNGLTLESVSIVNLDQTEMSAYDENNVFDAEGLKKIVEETAERRIRKNDIENRARVEMKEQDVNAAIQIKTQEVTGRKQRLTLERDEELAVANQEKEVETFKAERTRETVEFKFEQEEAVKKRQIAKEQAVQEAQIQTELKISTDNISKDQEVKKAQIEADLRVQQDSIEQDKKIQQARLERDTYIVEKEKEKEEAEIAKQTYLIDKNRERDEEEIRRELAIEKAKRDKKIGIIEKDKEQEAAEALRLAVVADREAAEQNVYLVEQKAEATRNKEVALIEQAMESEKEQLSKQIAADAEAYEIMKHAEARLSAADMEAKAKERLAAAILVEAEARAKGQEQMIAAKNSTESEVLFQEAILAFIAQAPELMREAMKPAEKISDIRVINMTGGNGGSGGGAQDASNPTNRIVSSIMEAGAALPMFKELLRAANIDSDRSLTDLARSAVGSHPAMKKLLERIPEELRKKNMELGETEES